jgi:hypothetical protein
MDPYLFPTMYRSLISNAFFEQGKGPIGPRSFIPDRRWSTKLQQGPAEKRKVQPGSHFCIKGPKSRQRNAIGSSSFSAEALRHNTVNRLVVRDETSWGGAAGAHCTPSVASRKEPKHRRWWEWPPFIHWRRRRPQRHRRWTPTTRSLSAPLIQNRPTATANSRCPASLVSLTSERSWPSFTVVAFESAQTRGY